ncbi:MAG: hypothetical protein RML40_08715 [Bacteroidota bacterium]|nr:T9SS type A sorting domain-containing protein [Candidatus Kapabacteria bacterium]MDW8220598.1 hypothetical protein [Bacteroidota bacterium]
MRFYSISIVVLALLYAGAEAYAQTRDNNRSSRGRDFFMTFLPNVHDSRQTGTTDTLYLYITSEVPTSGVIRYRNRFNQTFTETFRITNPNQVLIYRMYYLNLELRGYFLGSGLPDAINFANSQSERVAPQYVRVTADDDITVYGLNQAFFTSDAFLALPTTALGREYVVMAYKSDARGQNFMVNNRDETSTPSQFAVVATQDETDVVIRPSAPVLFGGTVATLRVRLNAGDSYLVQADPRAQGGLADLTGTRITATKPVAVFAGHQRTALPVEFKPNLTSRDHLVEQLPGIETWGRRAFITPFRASSNEIETGTDLFRVLAAYDSTRVFFNGQPMVTLNAGQHFEAPLTSSATITASDLILVAQFKKTSGAGNLIGDPFMLLIPTVEQYDRSYRFINAEVSDRNLQVAPNGQVFSEHFITVVAPTVALGSLRLDDQPVPVTSFQPVPGSQGYSFANIPVRGGVHTARCDSGFAIYVYGYGVMNSYGYTGGGRLRIIAPDRDTPVVMLRDTCFAVSGVVYDTLLTDSRIASVQVLSQQNVNVTVEPFTRFADSVRFRAVLQNSFLDGEFTLEAWDSAGFAVRKRVFLPGATVALQGQGASLAPQQVRLTAARGTTRILRLALHNYGTTTQTLTGVTLINSPSNPTSLRVVAPVFPLVLLPQGRDTITIIVENAQQGTYQATLRVRTPCFERPLAEITIQVDEDRTPPSLTKERSACTRQVVLFIQDADPFPSGIARISLLTAPVNCVVNIEPIALNPDRLVTQRVLITIQNPRQDAIYSLSLVDSAGNRRDIIDTVQGFTLELVQMPRIGVWDDVPIMELNCQRLQLRNTGILPYRVERITPRRNIWFSTQESQFPLVIPPRGTVGFNVCFAPLEPRSYTDTLIIEGYCEQDILSLSGRGQPLVRFSTGRCNVDVRISTGRAPLQYFMEQNFPNPTSGQTHIRIGLPSETRVALRLFSLMGAEVAHVQLGIMQAGEHDLILDTSLFETGAYLYVIEAGAVRLSKQMIIAR